MATVIAAAEVILQQSPELGRHRRVFGEDGVFAIGIALGEGGRCDVLDDPVRVTKTTVVG
jgi:hypothetical protein